ncbi:TnsD family Tn7-like transposition protein [Chitinimonas viridis]|uniref:TnsD family Tn7-like transposition protein n=1 Tax=Chitinimonas viridis TaxID=664880 RepID=A0ABT8B910_9NEIS|nr:TnsD family Tn7-like transposition protein [Chitinimonas viridis]MDN3578277.1 TnsD family Tn7-like transposition protein [Chitinimonas viridis]
MSLIDDRLTFAVGPPALPDETLFSWCSRYHRLTANALDRWTCMQLFGHCRQGSAHDIPARLNVLAQRTKGLIGQPLEIIRGRTLLPFYLPFKVKTVADAAIEHVCHEGIGSLKYRLGMLTSGMGAAHPLKICPACLEEARDLYGWSYWRRVHQMPGVWICPTHRTFLHCSSWKSQSAHRFAWGLPTKVGCKPVASLDHADGRLFEWMIRVARTSMATLDARPSSFDDPQRIALVFRRRFQQIGLASESGRVRWGDVRCELLSRVADIQAIPEMSHKATEALLAAQLSRLLTGRALAHPLRYVVWIACWFDSFSAFSGAYAQTHSEPTDIGETTAEDPPQTSAANRQQLAQTLLRLGHMSSTAIARQLGVTPHTIAAWAAAGNIATPRRPKKLDGQQWQGIVTLLREGHDKASVAHSHDIAESTVTRILRSVPGLQLEWHRVRHEQARAEARQAFQAVATLLGPLGIKAIRRMIPSAYAWLYRNDRQWLQEKSDERRSRGSNHAVQRIQQADQALSSTVRSVAAAIAADLPRFTFEDMKRSVPALGKAVRYPNRWPLTVMALGEVFRANAPRSASLIPS